MADSDLNDDENLQPTTPADEALLREWLGRVVDQDQAALGKLYDTLVDQVYGLALRITRRAQCAEEVVQDTFWQIWRQAPRFDAERGSVKAWVMTMARSRALDALRQLDGNLSELEPEALVLIEAPADQMPPDLLSAVQQGHRLQIALAALDPLPRQLLSLAFFRGLSHDEIAVCSGLPLGTVKSHIRRALQTMQQFLTADTGEVN
ncbi:RNA polymerase sigma factor [Methylomonas sp. BW4-1]|uniref:RNA polymerase sigma factor n=1 Tax=Methylomonas sp. BW4-1 TaxID=3376685 RepID=UPI004040EAB3